MSKALIIAAALIFSFSAVDALKTTLTELGQDRHTAILEPGE
jgi:hypothetical protein